MCAHAHRRGSRSRAASCEYMIYIGDRCSMLSHVAEIAATKRQKFRTLEYGTVPVAATYVDVQPLRRPVRSL
ncbi:protein of unknown function (plasmid) [Caballeronia sp. S22]